MHISDSLYLTPSRLYLSLLQQPVSHYALSASVLHLLRLNEPVYALNLARHFYERSPLTLAVLWSQVRRLQRIEASAAEEEKGVKRVGGLKMQVRAKVRWIAQRSHTDGLVLVAKEALKRMAVDQAGGRRRSDKR